MIGNWVDSNPWPLPSEGKKLVPRRFRTCPATRRTNGKPRLRNAGSAVLNTVLIARWRTYKPLITLARPERFELPTPRFVVLIVKVTSGSSECNAAFSHEVCRFPRQPSAYFPLYPGDTQRGLNAPYPKCNGLKLLAGAGGFEPPHGGIKIRRVLWRRCRRHTARPHRPPRPSGESSSASRRPSTARRPQGDRNQTGFR